MGEMSRKVNKKGDKWRGKETDGLVGIVTDVGSGYSIWLDSLKGKL